MVPSVSQLLASETPLPQVTLRGWVRTRRDSKACSFLEIGDGSGFKGIQVVVDAALPSAPLVQQILTGAAVEIEGALVASPAAGQKWEVQASDLRIVGAADGTYPLQKKGHTPEFLRTIAHLRPRTNLYGSVFRVRSRMSFAIHRFFNERGFFHVHTPIITASDCEGAGEMFRVTTLKQGLPTKDSDDFFGKPTYLTVSGQLQGEAFACALGKIYTFGPTFRAENSNTTRHAAEFWMIEPEMAFCDLDADMGMAEENVRYLIQALFDECPDELEFFTKFVDQLDTVTVYKFMFPVISPDSVPLARTAWCAADRVAAWRAIMAGSRPMGAKQDCDTSGLLAIMKAGQKHQIHNTPTVFLANGKRLVGATPPELFMSELEAASSPQ